MSEPMIKNAVETWHKVIQDRDMEKLADLLAEDVVFHSPVVHTPQRGKAITTLYLTAAAEVLGGDKFHYVREVLSGPNAFLEFETELDGIHINGIDMIRWNDEGQIVDFKVMVRPLKAINLLHQLMGQMLTKMSA